MKKFCLDNLHDILLPNLWFLQWSLSDQKDVFLISLLMFRRCVPHRTCLIGWSAICKSDKPFDKKSLRIISKAYVGVEGFEPPTLCLYGRCSEPAELNSHLNFPFLSKWNAKVIWNSNQANFVSLFFRSIKQSLENEELILKSISFPLLAYSKFNINPALNHLPGICTVPASM